MKRKKEKNTTSIHFSSELQNSRPSHSVTAGGFKAVSAKSSKQAKVQPATGNGHQHHEESPPPSVYLYPREGCIRVVQRSSALERHLSLEAYFLSLERHTLMDLAKQQYSIHLQEGISLLPSLQALASAGSSIQGQTVKEGYAPKELRKPWRLNLISANPQAGRWTQMSSQKKCTMLKAKTGKGCLACRSSQPPCRCLPSSHAWQQSCTNNN